MATKDPAKLRAAMDRRNVVRRITRATPEGKRKLYEEWKKRYAKLQLTPEGRARNYASVKRWRERHPEKVKEISRIYGMDHYKRQRAASGQHTRAELAALWEQDQRCFYCRCEMFIGRWRKNSRTKDHKVPVQRGGSNLITNIVWACQSCNSQKNERTADEFLVARGWMG